ncbi:MAG: DUF4349 domain-containing protein [Acidobacteria bacterium]|nr:DUF4349 domain-containing protein [Acidobacteriota bacterium]
MDARWTIAAATLVVAACGGGNASWSDNAPGAIRASRVSAEPAGAMESMAAPAPASDAQARGGDGSVSPEAVQADTATSYLAYAYSQRLELPGTRLAAVMDGHLAACQAAGEARCQLMGSSRDGEPDAQMSGQLTVRGEPQWLRVFMQTVASDAAGAGGRLVHRGASTEDLTRNIVDSEARLRASRALRDRLMRLLESRPGSLQDLLAVERELARVQAEIDATESTLAVMRRRVSMSTLTVAYQSPAPSVSTQTFGPLRDAVKQFVARAVESTAVIVSIVASLLPWAVVVALLVWGLKRLRRAARHRRAAARDAGADSVDAR